MNFQRKNLEEKIKKDIAKHKTAKEIKKRIDEESKQLKDLLEYISYLETEIKKELILLF